MANEDIKINESDETKKIFFQILEEGQMSKKCYVCPLLIMLAQSNLEFFPSACTKEYGLNGTDNILTFKDCTISIKTAAVWCKEWNDKWQADQEKLETTLEGIN